MRKLFTLLIPAFLLGVLQLDAQMDTLLFENFNEPFDYAPDDSDGVVGFASGNDEIWVNFDQDALPTAGGLPGNWYWDEEAFFEQDSAQGGILASRSWLDGFLPGNRNWLITPPIYIADNQAVLSWKSATFQGPRYLDGYSVLVSTGSNDPLAVPNPFDEVIFSASSMTAVTGDGSSTDLSNFAFSPGYIHADGFTLTEYFVHADEIPTFDQHYGLLEPHSVSLAAFAGQTIYIAFLHNADDCNFIALDDILITGNLAVRTNDLFSDVTLELFPNPATSYINIQYQASNVKKVEARIYSADGKPAIYYNNMPASEGRQHYEANLEDLPAGQYTLQMYFDGIATRAKSFIVK